MKVTKLEKRIVGWIERHELPAAMIPDPLYLKMDYRLMMGESLNLRDPKTFNEKIQWLKLHNRRPEFVSMVDKYEAKRVVRQILGEDIHFARTLGVWDRFEDIDFSALPEEFVLKGTHDSGSVVIFRKDERPDMDYVRQKMDVSLKTNWYSKRREWAYKNVKPRIMAEEYLEDGVSRSMTDYKFFCFNGEPRFLYASLGLEDHSKARISFFDLDGRKMPFYRRDYRPFEGDIVLPKNYAEMRKTAGRLAAAIDSPFVRIDLYEIGDDIYFSEITFYPNAGVIPFEPKEWDRRLGDMIQLKK